MKKVFFTALTLLAFALTLADSHAETPAAEYRGFGAIGQLVQERLLKPDIFFNLNTCFSSDGPSPGAVLNLLGYYDGSGSGKQFRNGQPNSTNAMLWHVVLDALGKSVGALCSQGDAAPRGVLEPLVSPFALSKVQPLCAWPDASARNEKTLYEYWNLVAGFEAPYSEFEAWRDFFMTEYSNSTASEAVSAMTTALFMNPHLLLRK